MPAPKSTKPAAARGRRSNAATAPGAALEPAATVPPSVPQVVHASTASIIDACDAPSSGAKAVLSARRSSSSDSENVILKLTVSGSGAPYDAYDNLGSDSVFESRPCELGDTTPRACAAVLPASTAASVTSLSSSALAASSTASVTSSTATSSASVASAAVGCAAGPDSCCNNTVPTSAAAFVNVHQHHKVVRLLAEFEEKSKNGDWPLSTSVHCYWCCHRFDTTPLGLPIKYVGGRFHVVGCFCSLECAAAYNFSAAKESVDECLNRYSMINALSVRLGHARVVRPAPDRLALAIFGGHMGIDEFRVHGGGSGGLSCSAVGSSPPNHPQRQVVVNCPPMQSVTQQVEEVSDADLSSEYRYIPIDTERVNRYQEKVRLMRTKPLVNFKNTLDHSMKLKYSSSGAGTIGAAPGPDVS